jgi:hypothetical protein
MTTVSARYITDDVDAPVDSYVERLGFNVEMQPGTGSRWEGRSSPSSPAAPERWSIEPGL